MRFVVYGAGGIGGVIGARLHQAGHEVTLITRGAHLRAIIGHGLLLEAPGESVILDIGAVGTPVEVDWSGAETPVVLLATKSQDTEPALRDLVAVAPPETPVVCAQNGVANERRVARVMANTYAMCVMCPTTHLQPGVVQAHSAPVTGLLDLGRFPGGVDATAVAVAAALSGATFDARPLPDAMRWKYAKLLKNLGNAVEALCGPEGRGSVVDRRARREGEAALRAAGIGFASDREDAERRGDLLRLRRTPGGRWSGGSSWQSLARGAGSIETDYLNGEIALLGRLHGVPTPVNVGLQVLANEMARTGTAPGSWAVSDLAARLDRGPVAR
jgi:2-dehydropantoate 2-reductase